MTNEKEGLSLIDQQKYSLFEQGFIYNPMHGSYQKVKYTTDKTRCFYNIVFPKNEETGECEELWISTQLHNLDDDSKYYLYILYLGKLPKSLEYFKSITHSVLTVNKIVNNDMIRYVCQLLEKHDYKLTSKKSQDTTTDGRTQTHYEFKYEKIIDHYTLTAYVELPSNKLYFTLGNKEENNKTSLLDIHIPPTISELSIVLNNIPLLLYSYSM